MVSIGDGTRRRRIMEYCDDSGLGRTECVRRRSCIIFANHTQIRFRGIPGAGIDLAVRTRPLQCHVGRSWRLIDE